MKDFDARLLKIDKKDYNEIDIYYIGYVTIEKNIGYNNIDSVNPLYLMINQMIGHFECNSFECNSIEEKNENKYLVFDDIDENKQSCIKIFQINLIIVKIISSICNINLFNFSHLYITCIQLSPKFFSLRVLDLMQETLFLIKKQLQ